VIREIWQNAWLARYRFESLDGKIKRFEKSGLEKILTNEPLCFTKHDYNLEWLM
jgi:hypothetical protein